jgi:hypothetical protein
MYGPPFLITIVNVVHDKFESDHGRAADPNQKLTFFEWCDRLHTEQVIIQCLLQTESCCME